MLKYSSSPVGNVTHEFWDIIKCYFIIEDIVYMEDEEWKKEYVMADSGLIWRGSHNRMRPCAWNFAQFEKDILECCVYLLSNVGKLTIAGRAGKYIF